MQLKKVDVCVWVDVEKGLPSPSDDVDVKTNYKRLYRVRYDYEFWKKDFMYKDEEVTHWLKPVKQVYVITPDELWEIICDCKMNAKVSPTEFFNSITNK